MISEFQHLYNMLSNKIIAKGRVSKFFAAAAVLFLCDDILVGAADIFEDKSGTLSRLISSERPPRGSFHPNDVKRNHPAAKDQGTMRIGERELPQKLDQSPCDTEHIATQQSDATPTAYKVFAELAGIDVPLPPAVDNYQQVLGVFIGDPYSRLPDLGRLDDDQLRSDLSSAHDDGLTSDHIAEEICDLTLSFDPDAFTIDADEILKNLDAILEKIDWSDDDDISLVAMGQRKLFGAGQGEGELESAKSIAQLYVHVGAKHGDPHAQDEPCTDKPCKRAKISHEGTTRQ